ncbi:MAG TPA: glycosyltransferase [Ktedonobacteraceae bacterium]
MDINILEKEQVEQNVSDKKTLFIVWYGFSRRAETLASEVNGRVVFQYETGLTGGWRTPWRYLMQAWKTWKLLQREQPDLVMVQSPPIIAPLAVVLWCKLWSRSKTTGKRVPYILDCHPGTFHDPSWRWALFILRFLARGAVVTLLCNEGGQAVVERWKVRNIFLPDGLPSFDPAATDIVGTEGKQRVAAICTFASVEPMLETFEAARLLPAVTFYVTGDIKRASASLLAQKPDNVVLTGFLRGKTYVGLLKNVDGIAILTKQSHDLSCGAYEALALAQPAVISDWPGSRRCFKRGFVYVDNTPQAIAEGVQKMLDEQDYLIEEAREMRIEYEEMRLPRLQKLQELMRIS